jgi:hypothetical protein
MDSKDLHISKCEVASDVVGRWTSPNPALILNSSRCFLPIHQQRRWLAHAHEGAKVSSKIS